MCEGKKKKKRYLPFVEISLPVCVLQFSVSLWNTQEPKPGFSTSPSRLEATRLTIFLRKVCINNVFLKNSQQSYAIFPVQFILRITG